MSRKEGTMLDDDCVELVTSNRKSINTSSGSWWDGTPTNLLAIVLFAVALIGLLFLMPLYRSPKSDSAHTTESYQIIFELPISVRVKSVGQTAWSQDILVESGPLPMEARIEIENLLKAKMHQNRKTRGIEVKTTNADVTSIGQCRKNAIRNVRASLRIRRQTTTEILEDGIIVLNRKKRDNSATSDLKLDVAFVCESPCPAELVDYAINEVLTDIPLTGSAFRNMLYSDSSAPNSATDSALLLPQIHPSIDTGSLSSLQVKHGHTLYYKQVLDASATTGPYRSMIDYQFEVPSLIFDHSSLIDIVSQTDDTIVFGFAHSHAYKQALSWPQTGFNMIFNAECVSIDSHDVYMLNGLTYDTNKQTVAAKITQTQMSTVTSSFNVTVGKSAGVGAPKPYASDVAYVDASFMESSPASLNDAYYANLDGASDSAQDAGLGTPYNSVSQAVLYDLADPTDFNDYGAYETLIEESTSKEIADLDRIPIDQTYSETITNDNIDTDQLKFNHEDKELIHAAEKVVDEQPDGSSNSRRRRRSYDLKQNTVDGVSRKRLRRGFFDFVTEGARAAFREVVGVAEKVASTVSEVSKVIDTATNGGSYQRSARVNFDIGPKSGQQIVSTSDVKLECQNCRFKGQLDYYAKFNFIKDGGRTVMTFGFLEVKGNLEAHAIAKLTIMGGRKYDHKQRLVTAPLGPIAIPGIFNLGPQAVLEIGASLVLNGKFECTLGASFFWDNVYTKVDMINPSKSLKRGWEPNRSEKTFDISARVGGELLTYVGGRIEVSVEVLNGASRAAVGFSVKGAVVAAASLQASNNPSTCRSRFRVRLEARIELIAYAQFEVVKFTPKTKEYRIFKKDIQLIQSECINLGGKKRRMIPDNTVRRSLRNIGSETDLHFLEPHHSSDDTQAKALLITDERTDLQKHRGVQLSLSDEGTSTVTTPSSFSTPQIVNVPVIFVAQVLGSFQLALKSDLSIIAVLGHDDNLYLSNKAVTSVSSTTFNLVDIMSTKNSSFLIQDATNHRYLHTYGQVQDIGYGRLRTHDDKQIPHDSNIIFWTYSQGYLQFNRGHSWIYDTAACINSDTGTVKVWIVDGAQGLSALQAQYNKCSLAPLVFVDLHQ